MSQGMSEAIQGISAESGKAMGTGLKGAGGDQDGGSTELYKVNQVYYRMLPTLSLVAKRTLLVNAALQSQYNGSAQGITFIFNSGEYYISCCTSYLYIEVGYSAIFTYQSCKALLSQGNILQLFDEITFTAASGTEVCREQNKGLHSSYDLRYNRTQEYIDTIGAVQGFSSGPYYMNQDGVGPVYQAPFALAAQNINQTYSQLGGVEGLVLPRSGSEARSYFGYASVNLNRASRIVENDGTEILASQVSLPVHGFCVPMDQLCGLFKPYLNTLLPAGLLAGGRLELRFKPMVEALQFMAPAVASANNVNTPSAFLAQLIADRDNTLKVNRAYLVLDAYQMQDNVLKKLNQVASGPDGLNLLFDTYDHVSGSFGGTGVYEQMISQARSRIVRSWNIIRDSQNLLNPYVNSYAAVAAVNRSTAKIGPGGGGAAGAQNNPGVGGTTNGSGYWGGFSPLTNVGAVQTAVAVTTGTQAICPIMPWLGSDATPVSGLGWDIIAAAAYGGLVVTSFQSVLGALYFPQQPITTLDEHYQNALYIMGKGIPDKDNTCSVTKEDFIGGMGRGLWTNQTGTARNPTIATSYGSWIAPWGLAIYGMVAEKNQALNLSGLPLSNARLLRHKFNFGLPAKSGQPYIISTFTQYTRVCKVFLGGRVVVRE